jgi:exopolysaccharide production protein ExoQ
MHIAGPDALRYARPSLATFTARNLDLIAFVAFILLILIKIRTEAASSAESFEEDIALNTQGDTLRQVIFIGIFAATLALYFSRQGIRLPKTVSMFQMLALGWLVFSASWSIEPMFAFRRAAFMLLVAMTAAYMIDHLGVERTLKGIYLALALCLILSYLALPLPFGRHPANELDPALVGNWKGVFYHKNVAGAVSGIAFIFFAHCSINSRRLRDIALAAAAFVFLLGTHSKTPFGFVWPALSLGLLYRFLYGYSNGPAVFRKLMFFLVLMLACFLVAYWDRVLGVLSDPLAFTGRGAIWATALTYLKSHFWFGAGYNSFWGPISTQYIQSQFVLLIGHSHNGFLEVFVTTGIVGFLLTIFASVILVVYQLLYSSQHNNRLCGWLLSCWFFGILQNLLETQFYNIDKEAWLMLMISIFLTQKQFTESRYVVKEVRL